MVTIYSLDFFPNLEPVCCSMSSSNCCFLTCIQISQKAGQVLWIPEVIDISPGNLEPACASSSLAFHMMYSAYKWNKQGDNIHPWPTPFLIWNPISTHGIVCYSVSVSNCCFLTCMQISQQAGQVVWYSYLFKNFPVCCCCGPHSQSFWYSQ